MKHGRNIGLCPICQRKMIKGGNINQHHWMPKSKGGIKQSYLHMICHDKIHSLWSIEELTLEFNNIDIISNHRYIKKFRKWVSKKPCDFYERNKKSNRRK